MLPPRARPSRPERAMTVHTGRGDAWPMTPRPPRIEIRVRGPVSVEAVGRLGLSASAEPGCTVLRGTLADRPALHGALERIRITGLELVEVRRLPGSTT